TQRYPFRKFHMMRQDHFDTYKSKNDYKAVADVFEFVQHSRNQKKHGAQPHNGQNVGTEDNERICSYGEDRRNTIHGKKDVCKLNDDQGNKKRSGVFYSFFFDEKFARFYFISDRIDGIDP